MEQVFGSGCSSGCESGWTLYLEHSMYPSHSLQNPNNGDGFICKKGSFTHEDYEVEEEEEEEEEDMSMVSDASSGPPHFQEQEEECFNTNNNGGGGGGGCCVYPPLPSLIDHPTNGKRQKIPKQPNLHRKVQDLPSFLDDTASSPFFNFSNNNLTVTSNKASMADNDMIDYSQGYSTTYFEGKSTFQDHFGFFHPSVSGTQLQQNQWFEGKR
ncbi:uncharacterized protein LOC112506447 [Cynara cardunculus var. scolymus]|uniref:uncharacterized protein LOC112506447 n=1 Tax=Cynara cardunculus var. scolymus TaxID=59895 RepID=UPI000D62E1AC|nr:uncharacterized protein LOC112506447 [Cynara cardunculus var. scolymus]